MAQKFQPGDIVQLKSGGPAMTIAEVNTDSMTGRFRGYFCEWFKGASKERAHFSEDTLQPYVPPKKA